MLAKQTRRAILALKPKGSNDAPQFDEGTWILVVVAVLAGDELMQLVVRVVVANLFEPSARNLHRVHEDARVEVEHPVYENRVRQMLSIGVRAQLEPELLR